MRENSIQSLYQDLTGQIRDQLAFGSFRWFTAVMAWVMSFGGLAIAWTNWSKDPHQRTAHHFSFSGAFSPGRQVVSATLVEAGWAGRPWVQGLADE